jgi:RNA polymerase sigma factor (sigma-70 family)
MPAPLARLLTAALAEADADLLGRFISARDEAAFAELVRRHGPAVLRVCRRLAGPAAADDAFQATFLVLACRAKSVRKAASVGSWLIGVAGRVSRQMRRAEVRRAAGVSRLFGATSEQPADAGRSPEVAELASILDDELSRLPESLRDPVVLCLVDGRTQEQAAAALGGSVRTVRRRLDRAKALLRARLERRGVVPAVAAGLVAGVGGPSAAVTHDLARMTVDGAFLFLTGGRADTPAAVAAKGVVGGMVKLKVSAAIAAVAAAAIGLGVGRAGDGPPADKPPSTEQPPAKVAKEIPPAKPEPTPSRWEQGSGTRRPNFLVQAPTWEVGRIVAREAEHHWAWLSRQWLGKELPVRAEPIRVRVDLSADRAGGGATTFVFTPAKEPAVEMELRGRLEDILVNHLPHEVLHAVLVAHFGKPVPRWADEGIALTVESHAQQRAHDAKVRELLAAGRGVRLGVLFRLTEYPKDMAVLYAQGHSVVRFLLDTHGRGGPAHRELRYYPADGRFEPEDRVRAPFELGTHGDHLLGFVRLGMDGNTAGSWAKAARQMYGFASLDEMEEAWLDWLKTPRSRWEEDPPKPPRRPDDGSGLIPPVKFPGAGPKP